MTLYVSNLGRQITDESLEAVFSTYGSVHPFKIERDDNNNSFGFAVINMPDDLQAEQARNKLNGVILNGQRVVVHTVQP
jgi:RNA recognition motif-containing protein